LRMVSDSESVTVVFAVGSVKSGLCCCRLHSDYGSRNRYHGGN